MGMLCLSIINWFPAILLICFCTIIKDRRNWTKTSDACVSHIYILQFTVVQKNAFEQPYNSCLPFRFSIYIEGDYFYTHIYCIFYWLLYQKNPGIQHRKRLLRWCICLMYCIPSARQPEIILHKILILFRWVKEKACTGQAPFVMPSILLKKEQLEDL